MLALALSALVYLFLLVLTPALLWKNGNRLIDALALKGQIYRSINSAKIAPTKLNAISISEKHPTLS